LLDPIWLITLFIRAFRYKRVFSPTRQLSYNEFFTWWMWNIENFILWLYYYHEIDLWVVQRFWDVCVMLASYYCIEYHAWLWLKTGVWWIMRRGYVAEYHLIVHLAPFFWNEINDHFWHHNENKIKSDRMPLILIKKGARIILEGYWLLV